MIENKIALVTGSSRGIGREIARYLQSQGCTVILNGLDQSRLIQSSNELNTDLFAGDLSDSQTCTKLESYIANNVGHLDYLVCNAGGGATHGLDPNSILAIEYLMKNNLLTTVNTVNSCDNFSVCLVYLLSFVYHLFVGLP